MKSAYDKYEQLIQQDNFISANALLATSLLDANLAYDSNEAKTFVLNLKKGVENKLDIVFKYFIITWTRNLRYSLKRLIPSLSQKESVNSDALNFVSAKNSASLDSLLNALNNAINQYLIKEHRPVEIVDGIILYVSVETKSLKVAFSENIVKPSETE
ncbi:hypothetical protein JM47_02840 [Ureaplasma diversum]|nr:hypothetical protein JM47_02840 [Ureaplasma diversum]